MDIVALVNIVAFNQEYDEVGDMNGDGGLNILDVIALVNIVLGN